MRSANLARARRHRRQSGQTLIEALVASVILGLAIVGGVVALDEGVIGAHQVAHTAWAECMLRGELEAVAAGPWSDGPGYPAPDNVSAAVAWSSALGTPQAVEKISVTVLNPDPPHAVIARVPPASIYKAWVTSSDSAPPIDAAAIETGCQSFLRSGQ